MKQGLLNTEIGIKVYMCMCLNKIVPFYKLTILVRLNHLKPKILPTNV